MNQILEAIKDIFGIFLLFIWALAITILAYWPVLALLFIIALCLCFFSITAGIVFSSIVVVFLICIFLIKII